MDPKAIAKFGPFEDNQPTQGQFRRMVVFNDGSKGWEIYEYGVDGPQQVIPDKNLGMDTKQASDWLEYQKKVTPVRTDTEIRDGRQVTTETPEGGQSRVTDTRPAPVSQVPKETKGQKTTIENGEVVTREIEADGSSGRIVSQRPATRAEISAGYPEESKPPQERVSPSDPSKRERWNPQANAGQGAWEDAGGVYQKPEGPPQERVDPANPGRRQVWRDGAWQDAGAVYQKPDPPTMINGKPHRLNPTTGNYEPIKIEGQGTSVPQISDSNAQYGQISTGLRQKAAALAQRVRDTAGSDSPYTLEDFKRDIEIERNLAEAQVREIGSIAGEQRLIQQNERTEGASRRSFATSASTNALNMLKGLKQTSPNAGADMYAAIEQLQGMQKRFAESIPGTFPDVSRTPLQSDIMNIRMPNGITITMGNGGGGSSGAVEPDLSNMGAMFGATPGMGMGAGTSLGSSSPDLTRPGFSEGMPAFPGPEEFDHGDLFDGVDFGGYG